jgi:hypothetical protein
MANFRILSGKDKKKLTDLYNLHGDRVLGDIPIHPNNHIDPDEIVASANKAGLGSLVSPEADKKDHDAQLGTVYVYDRHRLQWRLNQNKEMLEKAGWPSQADKFVEYLSWVIAPANTPLYEFIARLHDVQGRKQEGGYYRWGGADDPKAVEHQQQFAYWTKMKYHALKRNDAAAAKTIIDEASKGQNTTAMVYASRLYARGGGVKQDYAEAAFWAGLVVKQRIPGWRRMLETNDPFCKNLMGPAIKATDSDAAISTAVSEHSQFHDYVKLRDTALAHLTAEQRSDVEKRIETWRPASQTPPAAPVQPASKAPPQAQPRPQIDPAILAPGFSIWK